MREAEHDSLFCAEIVRIVEVADKHQVGDLLDYVKGIDEPACRKHVPKSVYSVF